MLFCAKTIRDYTVVAGEALNFAAYAYAPAILVTPLGALSIIFRYVLIVPFEQGPLIQVLTINLSCSSVLAHFILKERLHIFGIFGCILCLVGSVSIVLHAPFERDIESVKQVWQLATEPGIYSSTSYNFSEFYRIAT